MKKRTTIINGSTNRITMSGSHRGVAAATTGFYATVFADVCAPDPSHSPRS